MSRTLYELLGGSENIKKIASDAVDLHLKNPIIAPRFQKSDVGRLKQLAHEFFCAGSGGPEKYSGRDMRTAHTAMNISEQELVAVIDDIVKAMEMHQVGPQEKGEVVAILYSLKGDIVRV